MQLPESDGEIICLLTAHALVLLIWLSLRAGFPGQDPEGSDLKRILFVGIQMTMMCQSPSPIYPGRMQGLVRKHQLCRHLKSTLAHSTPQLPSAKDGGSWGRLCSRDRGWLLDSTCSSIVCSHKACVCGSIFLVQRKYVGFYCRLRVDRKKLGNHFILFLPFLGLLGARLIQPRLTVANILSSSFSNRIFWEVL